MLRRILICPLIPKQFTGTGSSSSNNNLLPTLQRKYYTGPKLTTGTEESVFLSTVLVLNNTFMLPKGDSKVGVIPTFQGKLTNHDLLEFIASNNTLKIYSATEEVMNMVWLLKKYQDRLWLKNPDIIQIQKHGSPIFLIRTAEDSSVGLEPPHTGATADAFKCLLLNIEYVKDSLERESAGIERKKLEKLENRFLVISITAAAFWGIVLGWIIAHLAFKFQRYRTNLGK